MRSVELRSMMLDALCRTQLIDCKARKDRDQAFDLFMSQLKEMKDVKERSRHQDKQSEKKLREIKESMAKDGLLSFLGEKSEHRMKVEESTVDIFRAERIQFFWATVTIYLMSFYGWVPSHQDSLIIVPNEGSGARLKTCEAPELPKHGSSTIEWYAIIKEIVGTDNFISGFELSEYTFRKGTVTSSVKELLVTVMPKEVSEEAIKEAFQRVKLAETNAREKAHDFLTAEEWKEVIARAYRDRDEGHDVDIEGLEATMQEQLKLDETDLVSEEAANEAIEQVKLAETNARENADDFLTPKEWEKVMARAYRDRDEGHDVDIEGLEATMQEQLDLDKTDL